MVFLPCRVSPKGVPRGSESSVHGQGMLRGHVRPSRCERSCDDPRRPLSAQTFLSRDKSPPKL